MTRRILATGILTLTAMTAACAPEAEVSEAELPEDQELTILVGDGPHREILEYAAELASEDLDLRIEDAGDDANLRVRDGEVDAVYAQHIPAFEGEAEQEDLEGLSVLARVHTVPYGLYSEHCTNLEQLPHFATVLIPEGQAPLARGLYLLQHAHLATLNREFGGTEFADLSISEANVVDSQRHLNLAQVEIGQFDDIIDSADAAILTPENAAQFGFDQEDQLVREPAADNPYTHVLVGGDSEGSQGLTLLAHYLESSEVAEFIDTEFQGQIIPANPAEPEPEIPEPENEFTGDAAEYAGPQSCEDAAQENGDS